MLQYILTDAVARPAAAGVRVSDSNVHLFPAGARRTETSRGGVAPEMDGAFAFKQCVTLLKATGRMAGDLRGLREVIAEVSGESIYHHCYQYFLKQHIHEYANDFAHWAGENLEERALAEHLSNIDPYDFPAIDQLRGELLRVIDDYLERFPEPRKAMPGEEFHFNETITLIFPTGIRARNLAEFLMAVRYVDGSSIYYHYYEARIRLRGGVDDFSAWIDSGLRKPGLAERIRAIDPFMHSVEGIREQVIAAVDEEVKRDMEEVLP